MLGRRTCEVFVASLSLIAFVTGCSVEVGGSEDSTIEDPGRAPATALASAPAAPRMTATPSGSAQGVPEGTAPDHGATLPPVKTTEPEGAADEDSIPPPPRDNDGPSAQVVESAPNPEDNDTTTAAPGSPTAEDASADEPTATSYAETPARTPPLVAEEQTPPAAPAAPSLPVAAPTFTPQPVPPEASVSAVAVATAAATTAATATVSPAAPAVRMTSTAVPATPAPTTTPTAMAAGTPWPGVTAVTTTPPAGVTLSPTPTPLVSTPTPAPASSSAAPHQVRDTPLAPGTYALVKAQGECLRVRDRPALNAVIVACVPTGASVAVNEGVVEADGYRWQKIGGAKLVGWAADMYLEPTSTPPSTAAVAPATSRVLTLDQFRAALEMSPWPRTLWTTVERVVRCESGFNLDAVGPLGHRGLMQVAPWYHGPVPSDAVGQLAQGYQVYLKQGWQAWECY